MKNNTIAIGLLSITAALLLAAFIFVKPVRADLTIKDRDYMVVTATLQQGGEALYITDIRSEQMAVFVWDPTTRNLRVRAIKMVPDLFNTR